jgi:predicted metal-binding membrane protein|tara:strand:- start:2855 stop:3616 length:762 start_codon:yes stop_codon:yes gene_type:complete
VPKISRDYILIIIPIIIMIIGAWVYLNSIYMKPMGYQEAFSLLAMPMSNTWSFNDFIVMTLMWIVMMFAMMMPSTFSFLYMFNKMRLNMKTVYDSKIELAILASTYFLLWIVFSLIAVVIQYALHNSNLVNMMGIIKSNHIAASLIIFAGIYQFTNLKNACLDKCRNPLSYIMGTKIDGMGSIVKIGVANGMFCIGCCWVLMLLLFVNGTMNLLWVLVITLAVLAEKVFPYGNIISKLIGVGLLTWGCLLFYF